MCRRSAESLASAKALSSRHCFVRIALLVETECHIGIEALCRGYRHVMPGYGNRLCFITFNRLYRHVNKLIIDDSRVYSESCC